MELTQTSVAWTVLIFRTALFLQRDRVRGAGGNFQGQEDVQRTRSSERIHFVSRNLCLCWGAVSTERRSASVQPRRRGAALGPRRSASSDQFSFYTPDLVAVAPPSDWLCKKKNKNQTKKELKLNCYSVCGFSRTAPSKNSTHTKWRCGKDRWHSDARSPFLLLSLFPKTTIISEKHLLLIPLYLLFKMLISAR